MDIGITKISLLCTAIFLLAGIMSVATETEPGAMIPRTMKLLSESSPEKRNPVKILFYGQSITAQKWSADVVEELKKRYPCADLEYKNLSIGGFEAHNLIRVSIHDVFPYYPDLIYFHVYGGHKSGQLEEMISSFRKRTTAEIMIATHHFRASPKNKNDEDKIKDYDEDGSETIRTLAKKYGCELVDIWKEWGGNLESNNLKPEAYLKDGIHLNDKGCELMTSLVLPHFSLLKGAANKWSDCITFVPVPEASKDGSIELDFEGNRIEYVWNNTGKDEKGTQGKVLIDGKKPSEIPELYYLTRPNNFPGAWWPGIIRLTSNASLLEEDWTLEFTNSQEQEFTLTGSKTGFDGKGCARKNFVSISGRIVIDSQDWRLDMAKTILKKSIDVGTAFKWSSAFNGKDFIKQTDRQLRNPEVSEVIASGLRNGRHQLKISHDGILNIKGFKIYKPPLESDK